jgi:GNAT superfamily N-acetyltransferase
VFTLRAATAADVQFMREMLYEAAAVGWTLHGLAPPSLDEVLAHPSNARYLAGYGRAGDNGVIAEDDVGRAIGAAWYRVFTPDQRGDGIVAEPNVPELAIGVRTDARGRGVGAALLHALLQAARDAGFERLSLSVDPANPARRLYARCGFVELPAGNPHAGTSVLMVAETAD